MKSNFCDCNNVLNVSKKIDETTIDDAEGLDLVMPMCNLIEYSSNYSETARSLWFYSKDKATDIIIILQTLMILNRSSIK